MGIINSHILTGESHSSEPDEDPDAEAPDANEPGDDELDPDLADLAVADEDLDKVRPDNIDQTPA